MSLSKIPSSVSDVNHGLSKLKPLNLISILRAFYHARSLRVRVAQITKLFELYDIFWCTLSPLFTTMAELLVSAFDKLPSLFSDFKTWLMSHSIIPAQSEQVVQPGLNAPLHHQGACRDALDAFLGRFNISLSPDFNVMAVTVLSIVVPVIVFIGGFVGAGFDITARLMKSVVAVGSTCKAWDAIGSSFGSLFSMVRTSAAAAFDVDIESDTPKGRLARKVMEIKTSITNMYNEFEVNPFAAFSRPEAIRGLTVEVDKAEKAFINIAASDTNTASLRYVLDDMKTARDKLLERSDDILKTSVGKCHPTVIWLFGSSGVGKSYIASKIVAELSAIEGRTLLLYTRNPGDAYWSGYVGQDIVLYDDFGAAKDATEHLELQKIYTEAAYPLEHAEATKKGRPFSSRYIIVCSNFAYITRSEILANPEILHRRRDLLLHVEFPNRAQFLLPNGNLDTSRLNGITHLTIREMPVIPAANGQMVYVQNGAHWNYRAMAQAMYDLQAPRSLAFQASLTALRHQALRPPIVLLVGDAGLGKTSAFSHVPKNIPTYDELPATDNGFKQMVDMVWKYDDPKFTGCVMACNETTLEAQIKRTHPRDTQWKEAFMRRMVVYKLNFRYKAFSGYLGYKYSTLDITGRDGHKGKDYDSCVSIEKFVCGKSVGHVTYLLMCKEISELKHYYEKNEFSLKLRTRPLDFDPKFVVKATISEADLTKDFNISDFKLIKGSYVQAQRYVTSIAPMFCRKYGTTELALLAFENANVPLSEAALLVLEDASFALIPEDGVAATYRIVDANMEQQLAAMQAASLWNQIVPYFDMFETMIKVVVGVYCVTGEYESHPCMHHEDDSTESSSRLRQGRKKYCNHEGWAEDCADLPVEPTQYDWVFEPKKVPKSALPAKFKEDTYCSFHHKMDTCFSSENRKLKHVYGLENTGVVPTKTFDHEDDSTESSSRLKQGRRKFVQTPLKSEACLDPQALTIADVVTKNIVIIGHKDRPICFGIMIHGRVGVTNAHGVPPAVGEKFTVTTDYPVEAVVTYCNIQRDLVIFALPSSHREYKDIRSHLPKNGSIKDFTGYKAIMNTPRPVNDGMFVVQKVLTLKAVTYMEVENVKKFGIQYHGHLEGASFDPILTTNGDCGSPIILMDAQRQEKFIGFHSAANIYTGFGVLIYRSDFEFVHEARMANDILVLNHQWVKEVDQPDYKLFKIFGVPFDGKDIVEQHAPKTTHLYRSPLKGFFEEEMFEPAIFSRSDPRNSDHVDPYEVAMDKWSHVQPEVDMVLLNHVADEVGTYLAGKVFEKNLKVTVLTKTEAINGVSYLPGSNPIYRHSSAGYPFKHWPGVARKEVFFEQDENLLFHIAKNPLGLRLNNAIDALITAAKKGVRTAVVFSGSLKDEPLKKKKIYDVVDSRSFAGCPLDYTIAHRMYFHGAVAALTSIHDEIPIKIGIDAASTEYHTLFHYHARVSKFGFDIDFKKWDATVVKAFLEKVPSIYSKIYELNDPDYDPRDDETRFHLHSVLHGPLIMYHNTVVRCPGGMVSGQPATATDNCIVNMMYQYYIWCQLAAEHDKSKCNYGAFLTHVASSVYGDDNIVTVSPEVTSWFNLENYVTKLKLLNLEATDANKTGEMSMKPLDQMSFLKRSFTKIGKYYVGSLEDQSFNRMLGWTRLNKPHFGSEIDKIAWDIATIQQTIECALREGSLKGEAFYNKLITHLRKCCRSYSIPINDWPSYTSQMQKVVFRNSSVNEVASLMNEQFEENYFNQEASTEDEQLGPSTSSPRGERCTVNNRQQREWNSGNSVSNSSTNNPWPRNRKPRRTNERSRSIPVSTIPFNRNSDLEHIATSRNGSVLDTSSSFTNEQHHPISHQSVQHMGRRIPMEDKDCRNRFSCRSTYDGSFATKYPSRHNNNCSTGNRFRMGNFRPEDFGVGNKNVARSEEHSVPLQQRLFGARQVIVWRLPGSDGKHAVGNIINRNQFNQRPIVQSFGSIVSCCPDNSSRIVTRNIHSNGTNGGIERQRTIGNNWNENKHNHRIDSCTDYEHLQCREGRWFLPGYNGKLCEIYSRKLDHIRALCSIQRVFRNIASVNHHADNFESTHRFRSERHNQVWTDDRRKGSNISHQHITGTVRFSDGTVRRSNSQYSRFGFGWSHVLLPNTIPQVETRRSVVASDSGERCRVLSTNDNIRRSGRCEGSCRTPTTSSCKILQECETGHYSMHSVALAGQGNRIANQILQAVPSRRFDNYVLRNNTGIQCSGIRVCICSVHAVNRACTRCNTKSDDKYVHDWKIEWTEDRRERGLGLTLPRVNVKDIMNTKQYQLTWPQQQQQQHLAWHKQLGKQLVGFSERLDNSEQPASTTKPRRTQLLSLIQERLKDRKLQIKLFLPLLINNSTMERIYNKFRITLTSTQLLNSLECAVMITNRPGCHPTLVGKERTYQNRFQKSFSLVMELMVMHQSSSVIQCLQTLQETGCSSIMDGETLLRLTRKVTSVNLDLTKMERAHGKIQIPHSLRKLYPNLSRERATDRFVVSQLFGLHTDSVDGRFRVHSDPRSENKSLPTMDYQSSLPIQCPNISSTTFDLEDFLNMPWSELEVMLDQLGDDNHGDDVPMLDAQDFNVFLEPVPMAFDPVDEDQPDDCVVSSTTESDSPGIDESNPPMGQGNAEQPPEFPQEPNQLPLVHDYDDWQVFDADEIYLLANN